MISSIGDAWLHLVRSPRPFLPIAVLAVNLALMFLTQSVTFRGGYLNSGDEYAYLVSAEIFSRGRLSVPSPPQAEFFDVVHVVNDGKFYGKYPPGWSLILSLGYLVGAPWIVNPLVGTAGLVMIYLLLRHRFSPEHANVAMVMSLGNPFLIMNGASYFSHPAGLLFVTLYYYFAFACAAEPDRRWSYLGLGLSAGIAFAIRPFTALVLLLPPSVYLVAVAWRQKAFRSLARGLAMAAIPFAICLGLFLAYNRAQTGNAFLQPFLKYDPRDKPSLPGSAAEWKGRLESHGIERLWDLNTWLPLSVLLLAGALAIRDVRSDGKIRTCILGFLLIFGAFFFYWAVGHIQYGPRYLYEASGILLAVGAAVLGHIGRPGLLVALGALALNGATLYLNSRDVTEDIRGKQTLGRLVREKDLANAIVFVGTKSGAAPPTDCTRNGIDFNGPVLFVRDLGSRNALLLREYPGRKAWYFMYDLARDEERLVPYNPAVHGR